MSVTVSYCSPNDIKDRLNEWHVENPKQHELMRKSVQAHGIVQPPLVDSNMRVVCGGLTVKVARELGLNEMPYIVVDHMSDDQLRLYSIRATQIAKFAEYDEEMLAVEIRQLQQLIEMPSFADLGFEQGEMDRILKLTELDLGIDIDTAPEVEHRFTVTQPGDCWVMEGHRLLCGDALQSENYDRLMSGNRARFGLSDVPYNLDHSIISGNGRFKHDNFKMGSGEYSPNEFTRFLTKAMRNMADHSMDGSLHALFMSYHFLLELLRAGTVVFGRPKAMCTWIKKQGGQGGIFRSQTEFIVYFKNGTAPYLNNVQLGRHGRNRTNAWFCDGMNTPSVERDELLSEHPTPKPVQLLKDAILDVTNSGDIVLDPFAGIGSIILAAHACERRAFAMEIDPGYVDVSLRRVRKTLGIEPIRESDGMSFTELENKLLETSRDAVFEGVDHGA